MNNRIFIAINLPLEIKKQLLVYQQEIDDLFEISPIKWTQKENLHITLSFIGPVEEKKLKEIGEIVQEISLKKSFFIKLFKISYGPFEEYQEYEIPKMVWARGYSKEFFSLQQELEKKLYIKKIISSLEKEKLLHITLGRINEWKFKAINHNERPIINKDINLSFLVNSIEIMNSKSSFKGTEYSIHKRFKLNPKSQYLNST